MCAERVADARRAEQWCAPSCRKLHDETLKNITKAQFWAFVMFTILFRFTLVGTTPDPRGG
jgi:hypothetical protein